MQLSTYINDLLFRYECVIIPGFGAFLTQYRSARIDEESHIFYPPGKNLSFNRQLQTNDGLLANYVASVEQCDYEVALQRIRNFTGGLSLRLAEGETVDLGNIGTFHLNEEKSIQFSPFENENFSTLSFGLDTFSSPLIDREVYLENVEELEEKTPLLFTPAKRNQPAYLKYAAIALIAVAITGFGGLKLYEGQVRQHNFVEKQKANSLLEQDIQEATFVVDNPLPAFNISVTKQRGKYHVIAGAFRIESNAHKKIKQLEARGFSPRMIGVNKYGLHQVAYSSFESRSEAIRELSAIKRTENQDAWLLVLDLAE